MRPHRFLLIPLLLAMTWQGAYGQAVARTARTPDDGPTPEQQAMGAAIIDLTQQNVGLRTQVFTLQAELERLRAAKAATPPHPPAAEPAK